MEQTKHRKSSEKSSLLILNDDCLIDIFKLLPVLDYVHLAKTCTRLLHIAQNNKKYKNISVLYIEGQAALFPTYKQQEFCDMLPVFEKHVSSINIDDEFGGYVFGEIADSCINLNSVKLKNFFGRLPFRNLKELIVGPDVKLQSDHYKNCFANNPGIEHFQYSNDYDNRKDKICMPLLKMLPNLKCLAIYEIFLNRPDETDINYLTCLKTLTKFSFTCYHSCDQLLIELAEKLTLVELEYSISYDGFDALKSFRNLDVLSIESYIDTKNLANIIFPATLKQIKLRSIIISCNDFLSIIKQLKLLEVFDMASVCIFWNKNEPETFPSKSPVADINGSRILARIAKELRVENRKLKLINSYYGQKDKQVCKYSDNLEIVSTPMLDKITMYDFIIDSGRLWDAVPATIVRRLE